MRRGSVFQRHTRACPRDAEGKVLQHKCRAAWSFYVVSGRTASGKRRQFTKSGFTTKRVAEQALAELLAREESGVENLRSLTIEDFLSQWLEAKRGVRANTRRNYRSDVRLHIVPRLGQQQLVDLRTHHVDRLYADLLRDGMTPAGVRHVHATLRGALNLAVRRRLIQWNPAQHVELPEHRRPETSVWLPGQVIQFLESSRSHRLGALFRLIAVAGLRRGEAIGLHWRDVYWDEGVLRIRWQLVSADGVTELGTPKTRASTRLLPVDAETMSVLRERQLAQERELRAWGAAGSDTGLVFTREDGSAMRPDYVSHLFLKLVQRASLPRIRLHDLRHTNASLALAAGVPMKVVSHRLGHSSLAITSDLYTHVSPALDQEAAEAIAAVLHSPSMTTEEPASSNLLAPGRSQPDRDTS